MRDQGRAWLPPLPHRALPPQCLKGFGQDAILDFLYLSKSSNCVIAATLLGPSNWRFHSHTLLVSFVFFPSVLAITFFLVVCGVSFPRLAISPNPTQNAID